METSFILADREGAADFVLDPDACEGIRRIADKVREDVRKVTGKLPKLAEETGPGFQVLAGILEESRMLKELEEEAGDYFQKIRGNGSVIPFWFYMPKKERSLSWSLQAATNEAVFTAFFIFQSLWEFLPG